MEVEATEKDDGGGGTDDGTEVLKDSSKVEEGEEESISRPCTPSMPIFDILPKNEDGKLCNSSTL